MARRYGESDRGTDVEDDATLVVAARTGDARAFAELYRRHRAAVHHVLTDTVHDVERRHELVQESFCRAYARLHGLRDPSRFRPWLLQIARNAGIDDLRARCRVRMEPIDDVTLADDSTARPESIAELRELTHAVRRGIGSLSRRDAAVLTLAVDRGFGPTEVAAVLDITAANAKVVLHRARQRLRDHLVRQEVLGERAGLATAS